MIILHRQIIYEKCYAEFGKKMVYCRDGYLGTSVFRNSLRVEFFPENRFRINSWKQAHATLCVLCETLVSVVVKFFTTKNTKVSQRTQRVACTKQIKNYAGVKQADSH